MSANDKFPDLIRLTVLRQIPQVLARYNADGFIKPIDPNEHMLSASQFIYPMAYFYKTKFSGNPYFGDESILHKIIAMGDFVAIRTRRDGKVQTGRKGFDGGYLAQRTLIFWLEAFALIKRELAAAQRRRWEAAMKRTLQGLADKLAGFMSQARFHSQSFYTGPNHVSLYAAALYTGAMAFKHRPWQKLALKFAERFAESQNPEGYWPEHGGPVTNYNSVALAGMERINFLNPHPVLQETIRRAFDYHERTTYPDFTPVALIDRRMRYKRPPFLWGFTGFTQWPRGRAFLRGLVRARIRCDQPFSGEECARWMECFVHYHRGPVPRYSPWRGTRYLGSHACFIRDRGWQVNFNVNPVVVSPNQIFALDYQNVVSLWHQRTGLIVEGSQGKRRPQHGNFLFPGSKKPGIMYTGTIGTLCTPPYVEAMHSNHIDVRVEADVKSASTMTLTAIEVGRQKTDAARFNLPLCVGVGRMIHVGKRSYELSKNNLAVHVPRGGDVTLFDGRLTMRCDKGGQLYFPCRPWNRYSIDNKSGMEAAFLRFEMPMTGKPKSARVTFRIS